MTEHTTAIMPRRAPLPMSAQSFQDAPQRYVVEPRRGLREHLWRWASFLPALVLTVLLTSGMAQWLAKGGVTVVEAMLVGLVAVTFVWVSFSVSVVSLGAVRRLIQPCVPRWSATRGKAQSVALLMPIYNETPWDVFGNAQAILEDLQHGPQKDHFALFVLSDTRDPKIAELEMRAFWSLRARMPGTDIFYRRRAQNTDKKVGNIADWVQGWGGAFDAMVVLDADSLMSGSAIRHLVHEMAADPETGLIQSCPALIGAETLFGRMQQFANTIYGWLLAEGLASWSQREGNYWGHNAIIRTRAFAASAHLPHLCVRSGRSGLILSHDFVEAGLLRRAGWAVRFAPRAGGSFEETPQSLIDYALRDQRWCQGNLQHLRLLFARGFHMVSRFHLLQGAVGFLLSPAWFALIVAWGMVSALPSEAPNYFSPANPLYPIWPEQMGLEGSIFLVVIYAMLLVPKFMGSLGVGLRTRTRADYGGGAVFAGSVLFEILCSFLYAPILMVQHSIAIWRACFGSTSGWAPQNRDAVGYGWATTLRFHWLEVVLGAGLTFGMVTSTLSVWLLPITISLMGAPIWSKLSGVRISDARFGIARLDTPYDLRPPRVVERARRARAQMQQVLTDDEAKPLIAAE